MRYYGDDRDLCACGSKRQRYELVDYQGIFCGYVCERCEAEKKSHYRPEMFTGYTQADVDEPIEAEDY